MRALHDVSLSVLPGQVHAVVGESGSGKSTLGRCVLGLLHPMVGEILFDGRQLGAFDRRERATFRRRVQPIFQDPISMLDPRWRVGRTIREGLDANRLGDRAGRQRRVLELLDMVRLPRTFADRYPSELSGGQRQRVAIAAALATSPELLVADEAVTALDVSVQAEILNLMETLRDELSVAILFIAHDLAVVDYISDHVTVLYRGEVVEHGPRTAIFEAAEHPYTRGLIASVPSLDPDQRIDLTILDGSGPSRAAGAGCVLMGRCTLAQPVCETNRPALTFRGPHHAAACHVTAKRSDGQNASTQQDPGQEPEHSSGLTDDPTTGIRHQ